MFSGSNDALMAISLFEQLIRIDIVTVNSKLNLKFVEDVESHTLKNH